jgi:hypothetical protein
VIDRRHPRQSRNPSAIRPFLLSLLLHRRLNIWTLRRSGAPFVLPYLLPSSVSRKSFVCHSYENCRGVYQQFRSGTTSLRASLPRRSNVQTCGRFNVFPTYLLFFQTCAHSFAMCKMLSHLFSNVSALFAKNHPGWGEAHMSLYALIGFPPSHPIKSPRCPNPPGKSTGQTRNHHV